MKHQVPVPALLAPLCVTFLLQAPLFNHSSAHAESKRSIDIGTSVRFNSLGSYDVGKALDMSSDGNDLGPGTLGLELFAGFSPVPKLRLSAEFGIAIGGLVGTDERYFGSSSETGSTISASAKVSAGFELGKLGSLPYSVGAVFGTERLSESTGLGFVRLTALTAGAWLEVAAKSGWSLQVRAELHKPYSASIEGQVEDGSPSGQFTSLGVAGAYRFDILTM